MFIKLEAKVTWFWKLCVRIGVFCLLFAYAGIVYIQSRLTKAEFRHFFFLAVVSAAGVVFLTVIGLTYAGK